jgi:hypothetical protein
VPFINAFGIETLQKTVVPSMPVTSNLIVLVKSDPLGVDTISKAEFEIVEFVTISTW